MTRDVQQLKVYAGRTALINRDFQNVALFNPDSTPFTVGTAQKGVAVADAKGGTPTQAEFNALLKSLRDAGIIAAE
jgi:hypothetical protein